MDNRPLILIKHAAPTLVAEVTAEHWQLSEAGRAQCVPLANRLRPHALTSIIASTEVKAIETGQLVARQLGLPFDTGLGLHEHDRSNIPLVPRDEFEAHMADFFANPMDLLYGCETAHEAQSRMRNAVDRTLREYPADTLGIVTHGTVMALLLAGPNHLDPFQLWLQLSTPSFAVVTTPDLLIRELVTDVG